MANLTFNSTSEAETQRFGILIGERLIPGFKIGLTGTLGSGKTRLVKGIAQGAGINSETVVSPTFTICVPHQGKLSILHLDAYRINHLEEVDELGLDEEIEMGSVILVEWFEKIAEALPMLDITIEAKPDGELSREYVLTAQTAIGESIVSSLKAALDS